MAKTCSTRKAQILFCVCVCVRACVRACARARPRVTCVLLHKYVVGIDILESLVCVVIFKQRLQNTLQVIVRELCTVKVKLKVNLSCNKSR